MSKSGTPLQWFMEKAQQEHSPGGCWNWTARKTDKGYGEFQHQGKKWRAHRVSYMWFVGPLVTGLVIDHRCSNPSCVNPLHLDQVTQKVNARRGRNANRDKELCKHGHDISNDANVTRDKLNRRYCKACARDKYLQRKAVASALSRSC